MDEEARQQDVDWAAVRRAYELTNETIKDICQRFGVTKSAFESRWRKESWLSRQAANRDRHSSTRDRLYALLERQVSKLANASGTTLGDKEAQQLTELVKNFDKLSASDAVPDNGGPMQDDIREIRRKLVQRFVQYDRR
jgi:transposase-like protein